MLDDSESAGEKANAGEKASDVLGLNLVALATQVTCSTQRLQGEILQSQALLKTIEMQAAEMGDRITGQMKELVAIQRVTAQLLAAASK